MGKFSRYITSDGSAVLCAVKCADIFAEVKRLTPAGDGAAMCEVAAAAAVLGCMLKAERQSVTLRYTDAKRTCVAVSDFARYDGENEAAVHVKCYVSESGGREPTLSVVRDLGLKEPHVTVMPLVNGNFCDNVSVYFHVSEQIRAVFSHIGDTYFLVQLLPGAADGVITAIENNIKTAEITEDILKDLSPEELDGGGAVYKCDCSRERTEKMLISLGKTELEKLVKEQNGIPVEAKCHFCDKVYRFNTAELKLLLSELSEL